MLSLLESLSIQNHIDYQNNHYFEYIANLQLLFNEYNHEFTTIQLAKILVAAFIRNDKELLLYLFHDKRYEDLPVILKCCEILDSPRLLKQLEKKTDHIKNHQKISKHKTKLNNLQTLNEEIDMRLTKSKIKFIKKHWIANLSKEKLEYAAILFPVKQWKYLIDLLHLKPEDFQLKWFTNYIFTKEYPVESLIHVCNNINKNTLKETLLKYKIPYDFLRKKYNKLLNEEIINLIFDYTPLENIIRHWDIFNNERNEKEIIERLNNKEKINMPYGELMKKIQMLSEKDKLTQILLNIAENYLQNYKMEINQPVVVLGDASSSMDIAIKTSIIITSILVKLCQAKMHLFRDKDQFIENPPTNVQEVLSCMNIYRANGLTAPVMSLLPYYEKKEIVKTFILVTDEVENTDQFGTWTGQATAFAEIFKQYREEVYPAKLVFVSFLENNKDGPMVASLKHLIPNIAKDIIQFRMNLRKPDLRKLDELLNTMAIYSNSYDEKVNDLVANMINNENVQLQITI